MRKEKTKCSKCGIYRNKFIKGICDPCFKKQRRLDSPLIKCECNDPDCKEMIYSIGYHGDKKRFAQGHGSKGENNSNYGKYGSKSANWNGGLVYDQTHGYLFIYKPYHPFVNKRGYVRFHRIVMEIYLSIKYGYPVYINPNLIVHHINHIKTDNRPSNLQIMTKGEHSIIHRLGVKGKKYKKRLRTIQHNICL